MNRKLLIWLDKTVFRLLFWLCVGWARLRRRSSGDMPVVLGAEPSILVIRPGGLGDGIMAVPFLRALRRAFPRATITLVCVKKNQRALEPLPYHDRLVVMDEPRRALGLFRSRYDIAFDLEPFRKTSAVLAFLVGAPVRVGFDTNVRRRLLTHLVSYANDRWFESLNCARQLQVVDVPASDAEIADLGFDLPQETRAEAEAVLRERGLVPGAGPLVAIAPGVLKPQHRWVMSEWAALVQAVLRDEADTRILIVGGPGDRADAEEVLAHLGPNDRVFDLVGRASYLVSAAILEHCGLLVACDGGIVYMGAAMGCATVSLWGPGVMERFKPPGEHHIGVRKDYPCIPCVTWDRLGEFPPCIYQRKCYGDLKAAEVFEAYSRVKRMGRLGRAR